jgi:Domain of unknown function (DUF1083).
LILNPEQKVMNTLEAAHFSADIKADDLEHAAWKAARPVRLERYWSGASAPLERQAEARAVWTSNALLVRFDCEQHEPLVLSSEPQLAHKTIGLWERDVCEIFIAPEGSEAERYFEFEAAPTGEWIDLAIRQMPDRRETDWEYASGMTAAARIDEASITIAMRIPWEAFARTPRAGESWRVNLFRCIGSGTERGYLAWQPTETAQANFHVPEAFGWLQFK